MTLGTTEACRGTMIPTKTDRNTVQTGAMQSAAFQISATNGAPQE